MIFTRSKAAIALAVAALSAVALTGCVAKAPSSSSTAASSALNVAFSTATTTLDPASQCTLDDTQLTQELYVQLLQNGSKAGPKGTKQIDPTKTEPYLAKSYTTADNGTQYTFKLNTGWTFPDGSPMNAAAVKYSLERVDTVAGCGESIINDLYTSPTLIKNIATPDASTVVITLSQADSAFPLAMATGAASIVDQKLVDAHGGIQAGKPNTWASSHSIGGGPFTLASYSAGTSAVLKANTKFEGPQPASKTINVKYIKSDPTLLLQAKNGSNDVTMGLLDNSAKSLESNSAVKIVAYTATANMQLLMPNNKAPWTNQKLREAATLAIPYQAIESKVIDGFGKLYNGPIPPTMPGYDAADSKPLKQDIAKAKALVAASGVKTPINVTLTTEAGDSNQAAIAPILQASMKEIGINMTVQTLDESAWGDAVYNGKAQTALRIDGPAIFSAGYYLQYDEDCASAYNTAHVCIPANTALLNTARHATSTSVSDAAYAQLTKNWVAASPKAILYLDGSPIALSSSMKHFLWSPTVDMRTWSK
jgi:peptide/nickel transport system substrate-binding protein